jgi:Domain of unknown function (DUF4360)
MTVRLVGQRRVVLAAVSTMLALSLSGPAYAAPNSSEATADVPGGNVTVEVVANNGSGCAPGTATVIGNADRSGFRVRYHDFVAESGGGAPVTDRRKNCQLAVLVTVPAGWTFAIAEVEFRGRARLLAGASGLHRTNYYVQGSSQERDTEQEFSGPLNSFWSNRDVAPVLIYSPCSAQRIVNINTELRVDAGSSHSKSSLSMRSTEGDVDTLFNFSWVRC